MENLYYEIKDNCGMHIIANCLEECCFIIENVMDSLDKGEKKDRKFTIKPTYMTYEEYELFEDIKN